MPSSTAKRIRKLLKASNAYNYEKGTAEESEEPPSVVGNLTSGKRQRLKPVLVCKIDLRLLPTVVLMHIMNYLDHLCMSGRLGARAQAKQQTVFDGT